MKRNDIRFYACPEIFDIQLVHGLNVTHHFPRHIHSSFLLGAVERGERLFEIRGKSYCVAAGECFVFSPHEPHRCQDATVGSHDYWALSIQAEQMRQILEGMPGLPTAFSAFSRHLIRDALLFRAMQQFVAAVENVEELFLQESLFRELMRLCLLPECEDQALPQQRVSYAVTRVREYLERHFDEKIRLEELSRIGRISPFYLTRLFQQEIGVPPYEYLIKIRLTHAQRFLKEGESLAGAAYRAGFSDQSHFSRFFKRHMGLTPGAFVRASKDQQYETR